MIEELKICTSTSLQERLFGDRRFQNLALCGLVFAVGFVLTLVSERIPVANGLGFDGAEYANWAMHFDKVISREIPISPYRMFRILPSGLAYAMLRLAGVSLIPENVIRFFQVYNLLLLGTAALAWGGIADATGISAKGKLLGFIGLFCNHAVLKYNFYYPVLTDISGYSLALISLYAYLRNRLIVLAAATIVGAFCWPTLIVFGSILLLFPRKHHLRGKNKGVWICRLPAFLVASFFLFYLLNYKANTPWYPLSAAIIVMYTFFGLYFLFEDQFFAHPLNFIRSLSMPRMALIAVIIIIFTLVRGLATVKGGSGFTAFSNASVLEMLHAYVVAGCIPLSTRLPGEFVVAHILYFGPLLLLTACFPRQTAWAAGRFGFGFFLLIAIAGLHAIIPLSRQWIAGYPVLVLATVLAMESSPIGRSFFVCFTLLSLFISKVWLRFNFVPDPEVTGSINDKVLAWISGFSFDTYISSTGRWMSAEWFVVQAGGIFIAFLFYYWYFYSPKVNILPEEFAK